MVEPTYTPVIALARLVFRGLGLRFTLSGTEHVPRSGGAIMAINHVGYLDFTFAGLAAQPSRRLVRFMAKKEVFDHPVSGPLMRGMRHIPVDRTGTPADSFAAAVAALRAGEIVGVFPEATISESFELKDFKTGAVRMAQAAQVPLLPCVVWGSQRVLTKDRPVGLRRGTPISIAVGEPLHPGPTDDPTAATQELKQRMQALLDQVQASYPASPRGPDDTWWVPARLGGTAPTLEQAREIAAARLAAKAARRSPPRG
jgi:1-acyl-sn-glycerol-3-phosphate acyltransferase